MKRIKRAVSILLCAAIIALPLYGCAEKETVEKKDITENPADESSGEGTGVEEQPVQERIEEVTGEQTTHAVVDDAGNTVEVPDDINRIVFLDITPLVSIYTMTGGQADRVVGMKPASKNAAVHSLLSLVAPEFSEAETGFAEGGNINTEELMNLKPDIIFYRMETEADREAVSKLEVPAIAFSTTKYMGDTVETLNGWVRLLEQVFRDPAVSQKAEKIIQAGEEAKRFVSERISGRAEEEKTKAFVIHNYDESGIKAGGNTFARFYLDIIGAKNVAEGIDSVFAPVNLEQVYEWNPEVIFLNSFSRYTPDDFYEGNTVDGSDFGGIDAVANRRVYKYPVGMYYWYPPSSDSPLSIQWAAKSLYPELFEDLNIEELTRSYYKDFYGLDLTDEQLSEIFHPGAEIAFAP